MSDLTPEQKNKKLKEFKKMAENFKRYQRRKWPRMIAESEAEERESKK